MLSFGPLDLYQCFLYTVFLVYKDLNFARHKQNFTVFSYHVSYLLRLMAEKRNVTLRSDQRKIYLSIRYK